MLNIHFTTELCPRLQQTGGADYCFQSKTVARLNSKLNGIDMRFVRHRDTSTLPLFPFYFVSNIFLLCYRLFRDLRQNCLKVSVDCWFVSSGDIQNIGLQNDRHTQPYCLSIHRSFSCTPVHDENFDCLPWRDPSGDIALEF